MALTNAQRQRYRERRKAPQPQQHYRPPQDRRSRAQRWQDAVRTLLDLQNEYQAWLDNLPDSLGESAWIAQPASQPSVAFARGPRVGSAPGRPLTAAVACRAGPLGVQSL